MQILTKTLLGNLVTLDVDESDCIYSVKEKIEAKEGIPPTEQRLVYSRKELEDESTLAECHIEAGCTLELQLALNGGSGSDSDSDSDDSDDTEDSDDDDDDDDKKTTAANDNSDSDDSTDADTDGDEPKKKVEEVKPVKKTAKRKAPSQPTKKKKKKKKGPKSAVNPYQHFQRVFRAEVANKNLTFSEIAKETGERWKKMEKEEKRSYEKLAEEDKKRYQTELEHWPQEDLISSDEDDDDNAKVKKLKKANKVKGAVTAYMYFYKEKLPEVKQQFPDLKFGEFGSKIGVLWKALSDEDKLPYHEMAEKDKLRYKEEDAKMKEAVSKFSTGEAFKVSDTGPAGLKGLETSATAVDTFIRDYRMHVYNRLTDEDVSAQTMKQILNIICRESSYDVLRKIADELL